MNSILIVGLRGAQVHQIERAYGRRFRLHFLEGNQAGQVGRVAARVNRVLVMTSFASHKNVMAIRAAGARETPVPGGMTRLQQVLAGLTMGAEGSAA